ncbi:MAG: LytR/AlgR family response regulator transcription factor [Saprospiraceae bacterium]
MSLRALIIDDEPLAHRIIEQYASDLDFIEIVGNCHLATEALTFLKQQSVDLIFLDINMPKLKGLDFLRILPNPPLVIITSAYEEYALESFELDVCDYLLKPFRFDRFLKAVHKAQAIVERDLPAAISQSDVNSPTKMTDNQLFIKSDKRYVNIELEDVFYVESYGNYVKVWLADEYHLTAKTLTAFTELLPNNDFFKIHKSFIINRKHIDYAEGNFVVLKNGKQLPIGKSQRMTFKKFLLGGG